MAQGLSIGNVTGVAGGSILVEVVVTDAPNEASALRFDVEFDSTVLLYVSTAPGDLTSGFSFFADNLNTPSTVRIGGFTISGPIQAGASGIMAILEFQVLVCPASPAALEILNLVDDIAAWPVTNGTFERAVVDVNRSPVLDTIGPQSVDEDELL